MLQCIEDAKQGDRQAFECIVQQYTGMAKAVAYEKLHDVQLAEDAVQEAFTEAFLHLSKLREVDAFPGWFKAIVVRQCYRILRRKQHCTVLIEQREMQKMIHDSIAALTSNMRVAVQLFFGHFHTGNEKAALRCSSQVERYAARCRFDLCVQSFV